MQTFLKTFFSNVANEILSKFPLTSIIFSNVITRSFYSKCPLLTNDFHFKTINENCIYEALKAINTFKAAGIDNLSGKFLKDGAKILSLLISQIWNLSIKSTVFPTKCKIAKLKPLFKKGNLTDSKNFRPIFLLLLVSKKIVKVIHRQVQEYLDKNQILFRFQSGLRKSHSTDSCLSYLGVFLLAQITKFLMRLF